MESFHKHLSVVIMGSKLANISGVHSSTLNALPSLINMIALKVSHAGGATDTTSNTVQLSSSDITMWLLSVPKLSQFQWSSDNTHDSTSIWINLRTVMMDSFTHSWPDSNPIVPIRIQEFSRSTKLFTEKAPRCFTNCEFAKLIQAARYIDIMNMQCY